MGTIRSRLQPAVYNGVGAVALSRSFANGRDITDHSIDGGSPRSDKGLRPRGAHPICFEPGHLTLEIVVLISRVVLYKK